MTQEEKAKAYDEAKARISKAFNSNRCTIGFMNEIFPDFKESEDERIRKELINYFIKGKEYLSLCSFSKEEILAWLEKQGEQKPIETRTIGYWNVQEMITPEESLGISSEEWNKIVDDSIYGEPRTAWSEVDEKNFQGIIDEIEANKNNAPDYDLATYDRFLDWLKSLKDRVKRE